jgi:hypothetical protein
MNDCYLQDEDYSNVQSEEDIKRLLSEAQTPGPNKYRFNDEDNGEDDHLIDAVIDDEFNANEQSFNLNAGQQRQQQRQYS